MTSRRSSASEKSRTGSRVSSGYSSRRSSRAGLQTPILGKNFRIPELYRELPRIDVDDSMSYVPVYCHLIVPELQPVERPEIPQILVELRAEFGEEAQQQKLVKATIKTEPSKDPHKNSHQQIKNKEH